MVDSFQLDIWGSDWGLPSVDLHCLQILVYAKFSGIPLKINVTNNPFRTPNGQLPVLRSNTDTLDTIQKIISFFRKKNYMAGVALSSKQSADAMAYEALVKEKIYPALQFIWWIDQRNLNDLIRPWYSKALPFPLNFYYPGIFEKQAKSMMECFYSREDDISVIENGVYSEAQKCLTLLSTKLGDSEFFFGSEPSSLDAMIYSYLALLLKAPLPNPALQNHLKACTNLVKFVTHISQMYFDDVCQEYEKKKAEANAQRMKEMENEFPNEKRNQFLAGLFAALAMIGYAFSNGIIEVSVEDDVSGMTTEYMNEEDDDE